MNPFANHSGPNRMLKAVGTFCFLAVVAIQQYLRPEFGLNHACWLNLLLGCSPNFFAAALCITPFLWWTRSVSEPKQLNRINRLSCTLTFVALLLWEFAQILAHRPFDPMDVAASFLGCLLFYTAIAQTIRRYQPSE